MKGLPEELRDHREEVAALRKEYLLGVRLDGNGVVRVYGFEHHTEYGPVIIMEYIDGVSLAGYMDGREGESGRLSKLSERRAMKIPAS